MVQLPHKRNELFYYLEILSNRKAALRIWVQQEFPPGVVYDDFDYAVHFFFDDNALFDAPEQTVGWILEDEYEVQAIRKVTKVIDDLLNELGTELSVEAYINSPQWASVVEAASAALTTLNKKPA